MILMKLREIAFKTVTLGAMLLAVTVFGLTGCTPAEDGAANAPAATDGGNEEMPAEETPDAPAAEEPAVEEAAPMEDEAAAPAETTVAAAGGGVMGTVSFEGTPPTPPEINLSADKVCVEMHADEPLRATALEVGENGGIAHCFVYVKNPPEGDYPVPEEPAVLDQKGCTYVPHVLSVRVDQTLEVRNSDPTLHNVRGYCEENRAFNFGQPKDSAPRTRQFDEPEMAVKLKCDVHPWMTAFMFIMDHPFHAVTAGDGTYTIDGLPDGTYTVVVWHEKLGEKEMEVTVSGGASAGNDASFSI